MPIKNPFQRKGPTPQHWLKMVPKPGRNTLKRKSTKERMGPVGLIVARRLVKKAMQINESNKKQE